MGSKLPQEIVTPFLGKIPMMAKQPRLLFSPADSKVLAQQRYEHPDPRVQQRFEVLWLISQKVTHHQAANLVGVFRFCAVCGVGFGG